MKNILAALMVFIASTAYAQTYNIQDEVQTVNRHRIAQVLIDNVDKIKIIFKNINSLENLKIIKQIITKIILYNNKKKDKEDYTIVRNKLKKLHKVDPELYSYTPDDKNSIYSVVCQSKRQPIIYTSEEFKYLPESIRKKSQKYWNFTKNEQINYYCPEKQYPDLGFIVDKHPKGYCIPCCKFYSSIKDSKTEYIKKTCLSERVWDDKKLKEVYGFVRPSRHILSYGNEVKIGRFSSLPKMIEDIFYNTYSKDYDFKLAGVYQNIPVPLN